MEKVIEVPGCDEPHGTRQAMVAALLEACADDAVARALLIKRNATVVGAVEEGRQQGREEGRQQGREEGRQQGREEGTRQALLALLDARDLSLTDAQRERIDACTDPAQLETWLRRAAAATSAADILSLITS